MNFLHPFWVWVAELGFVGFLASLFLLIWRGFDRTGNWQANQGWCWVIAAMLSWLLLTLGLLRA